jgi:hypothetical protein
MNVAYPTAGLIVSLVVMGYMLKLLIPRIAINRVGTMELEHLFGVTRVVERGNNHGQRIKRWLHSDLKPMISG